MRFLYLQRDNYHILPSHHNLLFQILHLVSFFYFSFFRSPFHCSIYSLTLTTLSLSLSSGCTGTTRLPGAGVLTKKDGAFFGIPSPESGLPRTNTLRNSGSFALGQSGEFAYTDRRKGAVPSKDEKPITGITTSKNYVTANAVEAILMGRSLPFLSPWIIVLILSVSSPFSYSQFQRKLVARN